MHPSKYLPNRCRYRKLYTYFSGCCTLIDHHKMFPAEIINKSCRGIHNQRRTSYDQRICFTDRFDTPADHIRIQSLLIEYYIRFDHSATSASWNSGCIFYICRIIEFVAFHTIVPVNTSVQFQYILTSGRLMKSVNILCNHGR